MNTVERRLNIRELFASQEFVAAEGLSRRLQLWPSSFETGTEDYYGYSWGGRSRNFYEHPFHAQVRVQNYNKSNPERAPFLQDVHGLSTETRSRELDRIPFDKELKFDMEVWHWKTCRWTTAPRPIGMHSPAPHPIENRNPKKRCERYVDERSAD